MDRTLGEYIETLERRNDELHRELSRKRVDESRDETERIRIALVELLSIASGYDYVRKEFCISEVCLDMHGYGKLMREARRLKEFRAKESSR